MLGPRLSLVAQSNPVSVWQVILSQGNPRKVPKSSQIQRTQWKNWSKWEYSLKKFQLWPADAIKTDCIATFGGKDKLADKIQCERKRTNQTRIRVHRKRCW